MLHPVADIHSTLFDSLPAIKHHIEHHLKPFFAQNLMAARHCKLNKNSMFYFVLVLSNNTVLQLNIVFSAFFCGGIPQLCALCQYLPHFKTELILLFLTFISIWTFIWIINSELKKNSFLLKSYISTLIHTNASPTPQEYINRTLHLHCFPL